MLHRAIFILYIQKQKLSDEEVEIGLKQDLAKVKDAYGKWTGNQFGRGRPKKSD